MPSASRLAIHLQPDATTNTENATQLVYCGKCIAFTPLRDDFSTTSIKPAVFIRIDEMHDAHIYWREKKQQS